jgi:hypothetical protein
VKGRAIDGLDRDVPIGDDSDNRVSRLEAPAEVSVACRSDGDAAGPLLRPRVASLQRTASVMFVDAETTQQRRRLRLLWTHATPITSLPAASRRMDSQGNFWTGQHVFSSGNLKLDLLHNFFLECGGASAPLAVLSSSRRAARM